LAFYSSSVFKVNNLELIIDFKSLLDLIQSKRCKEIKLEGDENGNN